MVLLIFGVGTAGLFTASVASLLIERYLRRRDVSNFEMEDHLVLCNWSPRGLEWIREVHAKIIQDKRPVVIIHDDPDEIDLPDKQDEPAFNDVYIVKGDPTSEVILRRAKVPKAHSVVILTDDREGKHADGKSILTCIAIRNICRGEKQPNIAVECRNPNNRHHLKKAGADEIISSDELGLRLLARTALFHGMTRVYQELLTVGRDANEMYLLPAPEGLLGKDFVELDGHVPPLSQRPAFLPADRHPAGRRDDAQPDRRRGGAAADGRPAHPPQPRLPRPDAALADRSCRRLVARRDLTAPRSPQVTGRGAGSISFPPWSPPPCGLERKNLVPADPFKLTLLIFAIIAFMYFTGEVLKPLALSVLLSFALAPAARLFERLGLPRAGAVLLTVVITLGLLGGVGYVVGQQLTSLANDLPNYQENIENKLNRVLKPESSRPRTGSAPWSTR